MKTSRKWTLFGLAVVVLSFTFIAGARYNYLPIVTLFVEKGGAIEFDGSTVGGYKTTLTVADATANRTITFPDATGSPMLSTAGVQAANGVWPAANALVFEGTTADGFETSVSVTDPTADRTVTVADASGTVMLSTLATNAPDVANSVYGVSNGLTFEGATANAFETTIAPTDPTADRTITLPDDSGSVMLSSLATNAQGAANSVWGTTNGLAFEGVTSDEFETTITVTDPTADRTITFPDASGIPILSNAIPEGANAVWGTANGWYIEGTTADANETAFYATDPTADRTIILPDASGTVVVNCGASHNYAAGNADWNISVGDAACGYISTTNAAVGAANAILPACVAGKYYTIDNSSGQIINFKVTGQAGGSVATGKMALYVCTGTDVKEIYEQP